jgi:thiol-disulfide isomerase/thioredoxin
MKHFLKYIYFFSFAIMALTCSQSKEPIGKATLTGKFSGSFPVEHTYTVKIAVPDLVSGPSKQMDEYETQLETDGSFSLSVPLYNSVYALFSIDDENYGAFLLSPDKETKIELSLNETNVMQTKLIAGKELTPEDLEKINGLFMGFIQKVYDPNSLNGLRYDMSPEEYKDYILKWTEKQISTLVDGNENLSKDQIQLLYNLMKWNTYIGQLFDYKSQVRYLYETRPTGKETNDMVFTPVNPDKSYYSFLRFFDWNSPPVFNAPAYPRIFQQILIDSILNIPSINNQPLTNWLKEVKTIMARLIDSDTDLFYDMLTLHAYHKQLEKELTPLSNQQIVDIKAYFKNPTFYKFLFTENEAIKKQTKLSAIIKDTPAVEKEKLIETIISFYNGKVVVVDFWATWCGPCLRAMKESQEFRLEMSNKNVVFLFITNNSSDKNLWEKKIPLIGGEHYYLTDEEWESLSFSEKYGFDGIPTYLIFDTNGKLRHKITAYPGNDAMRKMIEELI